MPPEDQSEVDREWDAAKAEIANLESELAAREESLMKVEAELAATKEALGAAEQHLAAGQEAWSTAPPDKPGFYWMRLPSDEGSLETTQVWKDSHLGWLVDSFRFGQCAPLVNLPRELEWMPIASPGALANPPVPAGAVLFVPTGEVRKVTSGEWFDVNHGERPTCPQQNGPWHTANLYPILSRIDGPALTPPGAGAEWVSVPKDVIGGVLCDVCQLLDGWHCDTAWTAWDETVRQKVSDLQMDILGQPRVKLTFDGPAEMPKGEAGTGISVERVRSVLLEAYKRHAGCSCDVDDCAPGCCLDCCLTSAIDEIERTLFGDDDDPAPAPMPKGEG